MATYLAVPLKRTWEVDLDKPLRSFIATTYTSSTPEDYCAGLTEINRLRNNMINKSVDKHETALDILYRYYDQLTALEAKVPMTENGVRINFKWQDAFDKQSFLSGKRTLSIASGAYEKVCVMFNVAALQSQVAESQNHSDDAGLKSGAKLFQQASGIFTQLKDGVLSHVQNDPTPDLHPDTLAALAALMLAQGQDCFVRKAIADNMKPAIVAKLAHQCCDFYAEAMKLLQLDSIRGLWPKDWIPNIAGKQAAYHALAEYYQSLLNKDAKDFGEEIARLRHAKELISAAESRGGSNFIFINHTKKIQKALTDAEKDNNLIYHARVPDLSTVSAIGKAAVAKSITPSIPMSPNFRDALEKVVPLAVHQALSSFDSRKGDIVNREIGRLRESTQLLNSVLVSLNLPASIEDLSGQRVPASLQDKAVKIREMGGITYLNRLMSDLPELLQRNREILDESDKMLNEEEQSDRQLRQQFRERWTRTASEKLTEPIKSEGLKYRTILDNATQADSIVQERYGKVKNGVELMSKSDGDLEKALPTASSAATLQSSPAVTELKKFMLDVDAIKNEREVTENEMKNAKCDMSQKFLSSLAKDGAINEESLSESELDTAYGELRRQVTESIQRQESILSKIQDANTRFCQAKAQNQTGMSREELLKDLASSFDGFVELKNNLEEGTKFYNDLTQLLVKFQSKVGDFCFARRTEKEELMKDLQSAIARQPTSAPPSTPSYQATVPPATSQESSRNPPPRPAPPRPPQPAAQVAPASAPSAPSGQPAYGGYGGYPQPVAAAPGPPPGQAPYPTAAPGYGGMPYPVYPAGGYVPPAMPQGFNPYTNYSYPNQAQGQAYPQQQQQGYQGYPGNPGYQQQWPR